MRKIALLNKRVFEKHEKAVLSEFETLTMQILGFLQLFRQITQTFQ